VGAFFIAEEGNRLIDQEKAKSVFANKGFVKAKEFKLGQYNLLLYTKIKGEDGDNYRKYSNGFIFSLGTIMYKNLNKNSVLDRIFEDFITGEIDNKMIFGIFLIGIYYRSNIYFLHDRLNYFQAYYLKDNFCISSSMLALAEAYGKYLNLDKLAITSNIISGCSFSNFTVFKEIRKIGTKINDSYPRVIYNIIKGRVTKRRKFRNRSEAVRIQNEQIDRYFSNIKSFLNPNDFIDTGLSGGYDSRLIVAKLNQHRFNYQVHTNYKEPPDSDIIISRQIAAVLNKELKEVVTKRTYSEGNSLNNANLDKAMYFYDGQIRVNHGWTREYRTLDYRREILGDCILGLSGHNGEQYRNNNHFIIGKFSIDYFVKHYVFSGLLNKIVSERKYKQEIIEFYKDYFIKKLNLTGKLGHNDLRRFYSYEWVLAGPGIRASVENQLSYFLMPFADESLIQCAEGITPHLGFDGIFEGKLITNSCSEFETVPLSNGYTLKRKINYKKFLNFIRCFIPILVINCYRNFLKPRKKIKYNYDAWSVLQKTDIPVNWEYVFSRGDEHLVDRTIAFAHLLKHFNQKVKF